MVSASGPEGEDNIEAYWIDFRPEPHATIIRLQLMFGGTVHLLTKGRVFAQYREVSGFEVKRCYRHLRHAEACARAFMVRAVHRS